MIKAMKGNICVALFLAILLLAPVVMTARHTIGQPHSHHGHHHHKRARTRDVGVSMIPKFYHERRPILKKQRRADTVLIAGSSLPDCTHACGSCFPCRLVMVSFVCANLDEAETCPMAYKCMCKNKSYPVP